MAKSPPAIPLRAASEQATPWPSVWSNAAEPPVNSGECRRVRQRSEMTSPETQHERGDEAKWLLPPPSFQDQLRTVCE